MTTSIKVEDHTKRKIDHLQAQLFLETGKRISQQRLMELLAEWGMNNFQILKQLLLDCPILLSPDEIAKYQKYQTITGVKTDPNVIDDTIYGD